MLHKGVFIVPQHYDAHGDWEDEEKIFSKDAPFSIEFCSGNGDWIIKKAMENPHEAWIAVEMQFERVRKIWSKRENLGLKNLLIVCGEALTFARYYLPTDSVEKTYVNFPDPWPKKRHAKKRLIQAPFVEELARIVLPRGIATYVTDDTPYSQQMIEVSEESPHWKSDRYSQDLEGYGTSWFRTLWEEKGREFHHIQYERVCP